MSLHGTTRTGARGPSGEIALVLGLALAAAGPAAAQTVRGQVVEPSTGAVVDQGFVVLLDAAGQEVGRTLADDSGRFTLRAPAPGEYRLRSERIGFRVTVSPPLTLAAGQTIDFRLEVAAIPIRLAEILVAGETRCRVRPEEGQATATVWEEARKALAAVAWSETQRLRVTLRTYDRELTPDLRVVREASRTRSGQSNRPFRAQSAAYLAEHGWVEQKPQDEWLFYAPDAQVLFSDQFLNTHCLRLEEARDSATAGHLGLAFEPTSDRKVPEVEGTMWLDQQSAELKFVEYRYRDVGLAVETREMGGRVEFMQLANGVWLVDRWYIRMPMIEMVTEPRFQGFSGFGGGTAVTVRDEQRARLAGFKEDGGQVVDVFDPRGRRLAGAAGGTLVGTVFDSTRARALIGGIVTLAGTRWTATTGPGGGFRIDDVPDGDYGLTLSHPDFPAWGVLAMPPRVVMRRGTISEARLAVPPTPRLMALLCPGVPPDSLFAVAAGVITDSLTNQPIPYATVRITWNTFVLRPDGAAGQRPSFTGYSAQPRAGGAGVRVYAQGNRSGYEVTADEAGRYKACGLPPDQLLEARVVLEKELPPVEFRVEDGELRELDLAVRRT